MTFDQFIINKYPLYAEIDFNKINVNWGEVFKLHDEWLLQLADNTELEVIQPVIVTVEVHEPKTNKLQIEVSEPVKHTQDNHLKTRL